MNYLMKYLNKSQSSQLRNKVLAEVHFQTGEIKEDLKNIADDLREQEGFLSNIVRSEFNYSQTAMDILTDCAAELKY